MRIFVCNMYIWEYLSVICISRDCSCIFKWPSILTLIWWIMFSVYWIESVSSGNFSIVSEEINAKEKPQMKKKQFYWNYASLSLCAWEYFSVCMGVWKSISVCVWGCVCVWKSISVYVCKNVWVWVSICVFVYKHT